MARPLRIAMELGKGRSVLAKRVRSLSDQLTLMQNGEAQT